jgi:hypothetical protein
MISREQLEKIMFELEKGECNTCGLKCKDYFCSKKCEEAFKELEKKVKEL